MQNVLKQSGERATDLFSQKFQHSRLILTAMYVIILAVILFSSSIITHSLFSQKLEFRFNRFEMYTGEKPKQMPLPPRADDVRADLLQEIIIVNGLFLLVAGVLSYWLAGLTLRPIQIAYNKQRQFLSDASHELRTPLAILQTDLENELTATKSPEIRAAIESHLEEVGRTSRLVGDLLTLSRLDNEEKIFKKNEIVDLQSVVCETVDRLQSLAKKYNVLLTLAQDKNLKLFVLAPGKDLLMQAVTNVINNAIKYNKDQGCVAVSTSLEESEAVVKIEDTGIGIAEDEIKKVFDRFYRAEKSRSRKTGGSGLGLSITQSIVESLNGSLKLTSELGKRTIVVITLPIHKPS